MPRSRQARRSNPRCPILPTPPLYFPPPTTSAIIPSKAHRQPRGPPNAPPPPAPLLPAPYDERDYTLEGPPLAPRYPERPARRLIKCAPLQTGEGWTMDSPEQDREAILAAMGHLSHGVYVLGSRRGREMTAMTAPRAAQASERPPRAAAP